MRGIRKCKSVQLIDSVLAPHPAETFVTDMLAMNSQTQVQWRHIASSSGSWAGEAREFIVAGGSCHHCASSWDSSGQLTRAVSVLPSSTSASHQGKGVRARLTTRQACPCAQVLTNSTELHLVSSFVGLVSRLQIASMSTTTTATRNGSLSSALAAGDRRHSSFHPKTPASPNSTPATSEHGSTSSQRKGSDPPAWLTAIQERDNSLGGGSEPRKAGVVGDIKGLFSRKRSKDATPKPKQVITSKHIGTVRNRLRADPRLHPSRRHSTGSSAQEKAKNEGSVRPSAHISAKEQEERHPHSGPPVLHGAALTTIISRAEEAPEQQSIASKMIGEESIVHQPVAEVPDGGDSLPNDGTRPRKKSVTDAEFKPGVRATKKSFWGGWYRDDSGKWTR